jgi:hypothetical protein
MAIIFPMKDWAVSLMVEAVSPREDKALIEPPKLFFSFPQVTLHPRFDFGSRPDVPIAVP